MKKYRYTIASVKGTLDSPEKFATLAAAASAARRLQADLQAAFGVDVVRLADDATVYTAR